MVSLSLTSTAEAFGLVILQVVVFVRLSLLVDRGVFLQQIQHQNGLQQTQQHQGKAPKAVQCCE